MSTSSRRPRGRSVVAPVTWALAALALTFSPAEAQYGWWSGFTYQAALSQGDTELFSDGLEWRNFGLDFRKMVSPQASIGFFTGWHTFNNQEDGLLSFDQVDVSGLQRRFLNAFPLLLTGHWYLQDARRGGAFVGLGAGTYWIENRVEVGRTSLSTDEWHFGVAPEVGWALDTASGLAPYLSVRYNYAFEAGDFSHSWWTFGIGIATGF
jgi:hypothetical protein